MKILSVNKFYHVYGGADRHFFELNEVYRQAGHQVIPFAMHHPRNYPSEYDQYFVSYINFWDDPGWQDRIRAPGRVLYSGEARRKIRRLIEDTQPDIAHVHLIYHQISPSILPVIKEHGIPIVQTLQDYKPICSTYSMVSQGKVCERCRGGRFYQGAFQRCNHGSLSASLLNSVEMYLHHALGWYDLPDVYVAPSDFLRRKMIEFGMPSDRLVHIPNFVNTDTFTYSGTCDDYFLYAGRLVPIKGVGTLLRAMGYVRSRNVRLVIVGTGPQQPELESLTAQLCLQNVEFVGYQSGDQLRALMANAMFSILPSEWYENCPISVLETMAIGKPTIGAGIGGIPELIDHGADGLLFESGNAEDLAEKIESLVADPRRCREMGRSAREKAVRQYSHEQHYQAILDVFRRVM
jgi:glycosyltransferase involved in cell wall biosynthesis